MSMKKVLPIILTLLKAPVSTSLLEAPASASLVPGQSSSSAPASASLVPGQSSSSAPASASSVPCQSSSSAPASASSVPALASSSAPASASSVPALASSSAPASASSVPALASSSAPASASSVPASASSSAPASASSVPASASSSAPASASVSASDVQPRRSSGGSTHSDPAHSEVLFEGWHKMWESGLHGLPSADILWLKEDAERGLFQRAMSYKDKHGNRKWRKVLKDDRMWFHPPEFPGVVEGKVPSADSFFHSSVFFWRPVGVWRYSLRCPRSDCPARTNQKAFLYRCGYSSTVRQICHMSGWYSMLTEVLACNACRKAAKESEEHTIGRFLSWDQCILNQLSPAHRAVFPAVLTLRRGVDKQVIRLMRDRTEGNTMVKVWRQVQESHCEDYLQRKDLYTTLLSQYNKPGKITRSLCQQFQRPPARREPPSARLMRKAFLISEADNIEDYRTQIMSTFGQVLKYDSTKKICKKLSGDGKGTAEWCTNVANEQGQILISVLTCEESLEKMRPMAEGLMERYRRADKAPPELMYVDRGCCRVHAVSSVEQLFSDWTDRGMLVRLDIFHWIHRFDAALRTDHHPKYALFKSALSAAVFAYNKDDMALLVQAIRAGHPTNYASLTDSQIIELRVSKYDLSHYVRRITVGAQETCARVQCAIDLLKGAAGMDENQVHLFKDSAAIDHVWENQQKHLECIQDPPGRNMYTITKYVTRNGVRLARYSTVRGSNSLEGFHSFLPDMIPGPHCAAVPFQVYLLAGIARWNSNRESASVQGRKGRKHMVYMSPLVHRLNQRCQELFGEVEEANYRPPVPAGDERIGLEYLFSQSSEPFSAPDHYAQTRETLQADEDEDEDVPAGVAEEEEELQEEDDDVGYSSDRERDSLTPLRNRLCLTDQAVAAEFDPCVEDVCGPNHLPGYQHVEDLCKVLVEIALEEGKLALNESTRQKVISAWNKLDLHDRSIQQFDSLYSARWGNALFGRTSGDPTEASLVQKLKFSKRYSAAHLVDSRKNRLMYCLVKQLWLHPGVGGKAKGSPLKQQITKLYQRVQQRVTVDDDQLSKLGIPILKINSKCVSEFIRRQEALSATNVTDQGLSVLRRHQSVSSTSQPPAEELPEERPHTSRPAVQYPITTSLAGTRKLKQRLPQILPVPPSALAQPVPAPAHSMPAGLRHTHTPLTAPPAVSLPQASTPLLLPSRSTVYKRKKADLSGSGHPTSVKVYICALCGQPTQGHKKYRKKSYCESSKASTSTNLAGQTFDCFEDFKRAVDVLLGSQSQASESV
nr:uncharacterized protein LOC101885269 [Danio rerio]|eukprot:XP_021326769.1 uncharacterized protein LOC101885269 [Danio rerio]